MKTKKKSTKAVKKSRKIWGRWYGGPSYSTTPEAEEFDSIRQAKAVFAYRADGADGYCPCVEDTETYPVEMALFSENPDTKDGDSYPFLILSIGPRGGVKENPT